MSTSIKEREISNVQRTSLPAKKRDSLPVLLGKIVVWQLLAILFVEAALFAAGLGEEEIFRLDPQVGFKHMTNKRITWRSEGLSTSYFNSFGLREPNVTLAKPAGTYRIALLGDSLTESLQVPLEKSFSYGIEKDLQASLKKPVQVLNFGTSGYSTAQEFLQLKNDVLAFKPDLVLVCYNTRDCFENWSPPDEVLTNVRPAALHLPGGKLVVDSSPVQLWMRSPRARGLRNFDFFRQHSRLWGLLAAAELDLSMHNEAYKKVLFFLTKPGKALRQTGSELNAWIKASLSGKPPAHQVLVQPEANATSVNAQPVNESSQQTSNADPAANASAANADANAGLPASGAKATSNGSAVSQVVSKAKTTSNGSASSPVSEAKATSDGSAFSQVVSKAKATSDGSAFSPVVSKAKATSNGSASSQVVSKAKATLSGSAGFQPASEKQSAKPATTTPKDSTKQATSDVEPSIPSPKPTTTTGGANTYRELVERTLGSLLFEMKNESAKSGAQFAVVALPVRSALSLRKGIEDKFCGMNYADELNMLKQVSQINNIPVIDLQAPATKLSDQDKDYLFYMVHLTPFGHQFVASQLTPAVERIVTGKETP